MVPVYVNLYHSGVLESKETRDFEASICVCVNPGRRFSTAGLVTGPWLIGRTEAPDPYGVANTVSWCAESVCAGENA
jgi:hypothetical protein